MEDAQGPIYHPALGHLEQAPRATGSLDARTRAAADPYTATALYGVEVWQLVNKVPCATHPIPIHDIEQQVVAVDGRPVDPREYSWSESH